MASTPTTHPAARAGPLRVFLLMPHSAVIPTFDMIPRYSLPSAPAALSPPAFVLMSRMLSRLDAVRSTGDTNRRLLFAHSTIAPAVNANNTY